MKRTLRISTLLLVVVILGSFQLSAGAEDISTLYGAPEGSFAETASLIPGYNAPYPYLATSQIVGNGLVLDGTIGLSSYGPADGFARTIPWIPGYNAEYPALSLILAQ
jgi:hypothetical protein